MKPKRRPGKRIKRARKEKKKIKEVMNDSKIEVIQVVKKPTKISSKVISERNLKGKMDSTESIDEVLNLTEIRLDRMNIKDIENLDLYTKLENLYLQKNIIEEITDEFMFLPNLRILDLSNNRINKITNLNSLDNLKFLDLSNNLLEEISIGEIPPNLHILNFQGNPVEKNNPEMRNQLISELPQILMINGRKVSEEERSISGNELDPKLVEQQDELIKSYVFESEVSSPSNKFDEIVEKLKKSHEEGSDSLDKPRITYYEQLFEESKKLREKRMKMMESQFESLRTDFRKRTGDIVNRSKIRREHFKKEIENRIREKRDQDVQTVPEKDMK